METMHTWGSRFNISQPPIIQKPPQQQMTLSREEQLRRNDLQRKPISALKDTRSSNVSSSPTALTPP